MGGGVRKKGKAAAKKAAKLAQAAAPKKPARKRFTYPRPCENVGCNHKANKRASFCMHKLSCVYSLLFFDRPCTVDDCAVVLHSERALRQHLSECHGPKRHQCNHCSFTATRMGGFRKHLAKHGSQKDFACAFPDCTFSSKWERSLTRHKRSVGH